MPESRTEDVLPDTGDIVECSMDSAIPPQEEVPSKPVLADHGQHVDQVEESHSATIESSHHGTTNAKVKKKKKKKKEDLDTDPTSTSSTPDHQRYAQYYVHGIHGAALLEVFLMQSISSYHVF